MKLLMSIAAVVVVAGCSSTPQAQPDVATLNTPSAGAPPSASSSTAVTGEEGRPRHRLDETPEESQRMIKPWEQCMKEHGADLDQQPNSIEGAKKWSEEHKAAGDACRPKLPLLPWSMDPDNPEYKDNMHAWVECMKKGGVKVAESNDPETPWTYTSSQQPANSAEIEENCKREVLGPKER